MIDDLQIIIDKLADVLTLPMSVESLTLLMDAKGKLESAMLLEEYYQSKRVKKEVAP